MPDPADPVAYYLRHPMHCGVVQFLHFGETGIVQCSYYARGLENTPQPHFHMKFLNRDFHFHPEDALPLATARKIWDRFVEAEGWRFAPEDRDGVRMSGWRQ